MTARLVFKPGVYTMPEADYHADPVPGGSLSCSGAEKLLACPARFAYDREHPPVPTAAMELGTAAHKLVLGTGAPIVVVAADDWRTKAAKEAAAAAREAGAVPLLTAEHAQVQAMAAAIRRHPVAGAIFDPEYGGLPEQSLFWQDYGSAIWRRARLDWLPASRDGRRLIVADYKTAVSASPDAIAKAVANFSYHMQAAWYLDGVRELLPGSDPAFVFVFQEKAPPYLITVCELDHLAERAGRARNATAIERYRDCTESGIWPGYSGHPGDIELISLPAWATPRTEEYA